MSSNDKPKGSGGSGEYSLMLNRTLRKQDVDKRKSARMAYEQARQTSEPPSDSELPPPGKGPSPSHDELVPPRPAMGSAGDSGTGLASAAATAEVRAATVALTTSVDQICEALVLVFGEMRAASTTLSAVTRVLVLLMVGQLLVFGFMGYMVWRLESVVDEAERTRAEQVRLMAELAKVRVSADETKKTVDEVKEKTEEAPTVEIVADENRPGSAVVRIVPAAPKTANAPDPSASAAGPLEIPLKLDEARPAPAKRR